MQLGLDRYSKRSYFWPIQLCPDGRQRRWITRAFFVWSRMTILVTERTHDELRRLARARGVSMSRLIREAVASHEQAEREESTPTMRL